MKISTVGLDKAHEINSYCHALAIYYHIYASTFFKYLIGMSFAKFLRFTQSLYYNSVIFETRKLLLRLEEGLNNEALEIEDDITMMDAQRQRRISSSTPISEN